MTLDLILAYDRKDEIKTLFKDYTQMLIDNDPIFKDYLGLQNYEEELRDLDLKYGLPYGRLYLALWDQSPVGCIGLRRIDEDHCEMKRLYVKPDFRSKGIGKSLVEEIIKDARLIGYKYMLLDTLPFLDRALQLYKSLGFEETEAYSYSPIESSIFMKLDLEKK